uniref:Androglobin n=1 Tax=Propithecus coquereli TaxID=379532 RepID=A0A2K6FHJ7_PROCO
MTSKQIKKKEVHRINSAHGSDKSKDFYPFGSNVQSSSIEQKEGKFPIWPEWSETDVNAEKWDAGKGGKEKDKTGKSPIFDHLRPGVPGQPEQYSETPVSTKNLKISWIWIISEIYAVWKIFNGGIMSNYFKGTSGEPPLLLWKPWEHIYSLCKAVKGHMPLFNSYGKYVVKLYWMGCWRKITIDDFLPFDEDNNLLLPATTYEFELWPMLLSKAIIKLANVDIHVAERRELGEFTVIHALTGWLPEVISLHPGYMDKVWELLKETLPEFKLSDEANSESKTTVVDTKLKEPGKEVKDSKEGKEGKEVKDGKEFKPEASLTTLKGPEKGDKLPKEKADTKDFGKKRNKDGEKERDKEKFKLSLHSSRPSSDMQYSVQSLSDCSSAIQSPHMVICATFTPLYLFEKKIFALEKMADSAEKLREYGLSHICSHPVLVTRSRSCPLVAPPKPPPIPPWKLIRPKKEQVITDEPQDIIIKKPEQFLEISSPFLNYGMTPFTIPKETHYVRSVIKKGTPPGSGLPSLSETDETSTFSQTDLSQKTRAVSQVTMLLLLLAHLLKIDFFLKLNIYIFHKPSSYCVNFQKSEFKFSEERVSYHLFVDSLKPIELLVCFSALVRWGEYGALTKDSPPIEPGLLTVETISWKSLKPRNLVLKIHTYATKATMVRLPVGRHMLLFTAYSPVGHSIQICSMVNFAIGDEDVVLPYFEPESYRFTEQSLLILKAVGNVIANFKDKGKLAAALKDLQRAHYPLPLHNKELTVQHFRVFHISLWRLMKKVQSTKPFPNFKFAFRAMVLDMELLDSSLEEVSLAEWVDVKYSIPTSDKEYSPEEVAAAIKIQAMWRGTYVRLLMKARLPDTKENISVADTLQKVWAILEPNLEQYSLSLLRLMFKSKCKSMESYPCYQDEETKIAFADYTVTYQDQPPNTWFIVFRETFLVPQDMILLPKVYTTLPVCMLHVVNNDTMEQVPKVFQKVVPYLYTKNKKGYTFVAEVFTGDTYAVASRWKLRLIGSYTPLPCLSRDSPCNTFTIKEIRDHYIPNDKKILFRYKYMTKGKIPLANSINKGKFQMYWKFHCKILIHKSNKIIDDVGDHFLCPEHKRENPKGQHYKYIIQCLVLYNSWPLTENQLTFVQALKDLEKSDKKEQILRDLWHTITHTSINIMGTPEGEEKKKVAERLFEEIMAKNTSTLHSQQEDPNKPYWILRLVTEHSESELFEVRKDTERADEIRAMKQAWETTEPGRAIKAAQARLHYLRRFIQKPSDAESTPVAESQTKPVEEAHIEKHEELVTLGSPESHTIKPHSRSPTILETSPRLIRKALEFMDLNQYVRKSEKEPLLQTDELNQQQAMQKAEEVHQFRQYRTRVLSIRDIDQDERFKLKDEILDMYGEMRVSLKVLTWITVEKFFCNIRKEIIESYICVCSCSQELCMSALCAVCMPPSPGTHSRRSITCKR